MGADGDEMCDLLASRLVNGTNITSDIDTPVSVVEFPSEFVIPETWISRLNCEELKTIEYPSLIFGS